MTPALFFGLLVSFVAGLIVGLAWPNGETTNIVNQADCTAGGDIVGRDKS